MCVNYPPPAYTQSDPAQTARFILWLLLKERTSRLSVSLDFPARFAPEIRQFETTKIFFTRFARARSCGENRPNALKPSRNAENRCVFELASSRAPIRNIFTFWNKYPKRYIRIYEKMLIEKIISGVYNINRDLNVND